MNKTGYLFYIRTTIASLDPRSSQLTNSALDHRLPVHTQPEFPQLDTRREGGTDLLTMFSTLFGERPPSPQGVTKGSNVVLGHLLYWRKDRTVAHHHKQTSGWVLEKASRGLADPLAFAHCPAARYTDKPKRMKINP